MSVQNARMAGCAIVTRDHANAQIYFTVLLASTWYAQEAPQTRATAMGGEISPHLLTGSLVRRGMTIAWCIVSKRIEVQTSSQSTAESPTLREFRGAV